MASREIRDLHPEVQVKWNKFHDRCRRDVELLKRGMSVLLTCSYRPADEQVKLGLSAKDAICQRGTDAKPVSRGFEIVVLHYGLPHAPVGQITEHALSLGLSNPRDNYFEG